MIEHRRDRIGERAFERRLPEGGRGRRQGLLAGGQFRASVK